MVRSSSRPPISVRLYVELYSHSLRTKKQSKAIYPGTSGVMSSFPLSRRTLLSSTKCQAGSRKLPSTSPRSRKPRGFLGLPALPGMCYEHLEREWAVPIFFFLYRKYESGGVGTLTHLIALQGTNYACELEIYCDGYLFK